MTNEKDREDARELCEDMSSVSLTGIFDPTVEKFVSVAAEKIARIRSEAVKEERERCAERAEQWRSTEMKKLIDGDRAFDGISLMNAILSDDHEADKKDDESRFTDKNGTIIHPVFLDD